MGSIAARSLRRERAGAGGVNGSGVWQLLETPAAPGAWNMAVDEWLMESVRAGDAPTLRLYGWSPACLSLGRNQPARGAYGAEELKRARVDVVRRRTGGRAVLHDREVTYSVVAPAGLLGTAKQTYLAINQVLLQAMLSLGVRAALANGNGRSTPVPSTIPCFAESLPGEIQLDGRKLIGSAQLHQQGVLLQHGSILLDPSPAAAVLAGVSRAAVDDSSAYLGDSLAADPSTVREAIAGAWSDRHGRLATVPLPAAARPRIAELAEMYQDDRWTWRR